ncbi:MAG: gliding motility protein GldM, partial [Bacteroidota bacterium]
MINLMYLIFIAMLALNMSKEVLAAFGLMNEKMVESNKKTTLTNDHFLASLGTKADENSQKYGQLYQDAQKIKQLSQEYYDYLENLKDEMTKDIEDPTDYTVMDKSDYLDQKFFQGDNLAPKGQEFLKWINDYRTQVMAILPEKMVDAKDAVKARFKTGDEQGKVEKRDGTKQDWINYHYEGFPLIASLTKLTALQADIKATEEDALKSMLQGQLSSEVSMSNYTTLLKQNKTPYAGEAYDGSIVLGREDASTKPNEVHLTLDGRKLSEGRDFELDGGQVKLKVNAGGAGDHELKGKLIFY